MELIKKDFNIKQQSLQLVLLIALSLGLSACGGELEPSEGGTPPTPPTTDPITPPTTDPVEHLGSWENKDEDGDGVPDELDDYPFDASKYQFPQFIEVEPNDNPSIATATNMTPPFTIIGGISQKSDNGDLYSFTGKAGQFYTLILKYQHPDFKPNIYFSDAQGNALNFGEIKIDPVLKTLAISAQMTKDGLYHIGVNDINFDGRASFTYSANLFTDMDSDGIYDLQEIALGMDPSSDDTDGDGISDTAEYLFGRNTLGFDPDGDGIPNWRDLDSDGDGLSDTIEGENDADSDGLGNFVDLDSDGNDLPDIDEAGSNPKHPLDQDIDSIPDFLDLDDDNDGLLDINDLQRLRAVNVSPSSVLGQPYGVYNQAKLPFLVEGDIVYVELDAPLSTLAHFIVVTRDRLPPINLPISNSSGAFRASLPEGAKTIFISDGELRSNIRQLELPPKGTPVISSVNAVMLTENKQVTLAGVGLDSNITITANGVPMELISSSADAVTLKVPAELTDGKLQANNALGQSNQVQYFVLNDIDITVKPVGTTPTNDIRIETLLNTSYQSDSEGYVVATRFKHRLTPVTAFLPSANSQSTQYLSSYILPHDQSLELDISNTTFKYVLDFIGVDKIPLASLADFRTTIRNYAEFTELEEHLNGLLLNSPSALASLPSQTSALLLVKSRQIFEKYATTQSLVSAKISAQLTKNFSSQLAKANATSGSIQPTITNYGTDHFDYGLTATNFLDNWLPSDPSCPNNTEITNEQKDKLSYDGCSELQNRTRLYLSTLIIPLGKDGEYDESLLDTPLRKHAQTAWDGNIMGPQSGTFLGLELILH